MNDVFSVAPETNEMDRQWVFVQFNTYVQELGKMPDHDPTLPGSALFTLFLKMSSLAKGSGYINYDELLQRVLKSCRQRWPEKDVRFQLRRAYDKAQPMVRGSL